MDEQVKTEGVPGLLYRFTENERRLIERRIAAYQAVVKFIIELHGLEALGVDLVEAPDHSGILMPPGFATVPGKEDSHPQK